MATPRRKPFFGGAAGVKYMWVKIHSIYKRRLACHHEDRLHPSLRLIRNLMTRWDIAGGMCKSKQIHSYCLHLQNDLWLVLITGSFRINIRQ